MPPKSRTPLLALLFVLAVAAQACALAPRLAASVPPPTASPQALATEPPATAIPPLQSHTSTPRAVPTAALIYTPTPAPVSLKAVGGSLAIRSGPAPVFDAVASLPEGQTVPVYARSIQDGWVQIPIPSQPGVLGWVSTKAGFSEVDGYVLDLPLITRVEWPFGAYLRNCTDHQVMVEPGDTTLPPASAAPANRVWFTPGLYTVYDLDVSGRPVITQVKLWSHTSINLTRDGSGQKYLCP